MYCQNNTPSNQRILHCRVRKGGRNYSSSDEDTGEAIAVNIAVLRNKYKLHFCLFATFLCICIDNKSLLLSFRGQV